MDVSSDQKSEISTQKIHVKNLWQLRKFTKGGVTLQIHMPEETSIATETGE